MCRAQGELREFRSYVQLHHEAHVDEDALPPGRDASNLDLTAQFAGRDLVRAVVVAVDDAARYHVSVAPEGMGLVRSGA